MFEERKAPVVKDPESLKAIKVGCDSHRGRVQHGPCFTGAQRDAFPNMKRRGGGDAKVEYNDTEQVVGQVAMQELSPECVC